MKRTAFDLSYGIEEEFFLVDPAGGDLASQVPPRFFRACRLARLTRCCWWTRTTKSSTA